MGTTESGFRLRRRLIKTTQLLQDLRVIFHTLFQTTEGLPTTNKVLPVPPYSLLSLLTTI